MPTFHLILFLAFVLAIVWMPFSPISAAILAVLTLVWNFYCGHFSWERFFKTIGLTILLIGLPLLLICLWEPGATGRTLVIAFRSLLILLTVSTLPNLLPSNKLGIALRGLHLPKPLFLLLLQIFLQLSRLRSQTERLLQAIRLRRAVSRFGILAPSCLRSLPTLWMFRCAHTAERTARAMELRGFGTEEEPAPEEKRI